MDNVSQTIGCFDDDAGRNMLSYLERLSDDLNTMSEDFDGHTKGAKSTEDTNSINNAEVQNLLNNEVESGGKSIDVSEILRQSLSNFNENSITVSCISFHYYTIIVVVTSIGRTLLLCLLYLQQFQCELFFIFSYFL